MFRPMSAIFTLFTYKKQIQEFSLEQFQLGKEVRRVLQQIRSTDGKPRRSPFKQTHYFNIINHPYSCSEWKLKSNKRNVLYIEFHEERPPHAAVGPPSWLTASTPACYSTRKDQNLALWVTALRRLVKIYRRFGTYKTPWNVGESL